MNSKKQNNAKKVFFSLGCCTQIFEFLAPYEEIISNYQHLNKRFYKTILPQIKGSVTLYHVPWSKFSFILQSSQELTIFRTLRNKELCLTKDFSNLDTNCFRQLSIEDYCQVGLHQIAVLVKIQTLKSVEIYNFSKTTVQ